jgi:glutamate--cysteine ligase
MLQRGGQPIALTDWLREVLQALPPLAEALDAALGGAAPNAQFGSLSGTHASAATAYRDTLARVTALATAPAQLPSARVLQAITGPYANSFSAFALAQSNAARAAINALPYPDALRQHFAQLARASAAEQARIEARDTVPFELYRREYLAPARLEPSRTTGTLPGA